MLVTNICAQLNSEFEQYLEELSAEIEIDQFVPDSANLPDVVILDAREKEEFDVSRLKGARRIGYNKFDISIIDSLDKSQEIIVYCSVGYRSSKIAIELKQAGFQAVKNLYGGIFRWANAGYPIYNGSNRTMKIHAYNKHWGSFITNPSLEKVY